VRRIFELYAYHGHTLDSLVQQLADENRTYTDATPRFPRSKVHAILRDRAYIGEVSYRDQWYPGSQKPLVDRATFDRVEVLLGEATYQPHELVYGGEMITCGHCGSPITGERKQKKTKQGTKSYVYYRCSRYNSKDHPRTRLREADIEVQVLGMFDALRIQDDDIRDWFARVLQAKTRDRQKVRKERIAELKTDYVTAESAG
jgi:hypothetical protein